jgi:carbonic anhydrase
MSRLVLNIAAVMVCACCGVRAEVSVAEPPPKTVEKVDLRSPEVSDKVWRELLEGNKRFVEGKAQTREVVEKRKELAKGQKPKTIVLACADSRVSPELLFDQNLGDLFVIRTAGNIGGKIVVGSIEYAAAELQCNLLVILGHEHCGAVKAAASGEKMPSENLKKIVDDIEPAVRDARRDGAVADAVIARAIENNIRLSADNVVKNSEILKNFVDAKKLKIVRALYKLETGEVVDLDAKPANPEVTK